MKLSTILIFLFPASICLAQIDSIFIEFMNGTVRCYAIPSIQEIRFFGSSAGVNDKQLMLNLIKSFTLQQNYPNPFNPSTNIVYELPHSGSVEITIFDIIGRVIRIFRIYHQQAGVHTAVWNGQNDSGISVSSGTYFCRVQFENNYMVNKLLLIK
jgi:hypothetical protein